MKPDISPAKSIQDSFQSLRKGFNGLLICLIMVTIFSFLAIGYLMIQANQKVYVVSPHQTFMAYAAYNHEVSIFEARNQIKNFCENLFSWDKDSYTAHMEIALSLIDHSDGLKLFNTFKGNEVYENLVSTSAKVSIQMDSIHLNMEALPIQGVFYLTQNWQSVGGNQSQKIKAQFELINVSRSETNPYGLLIQKIRFLEYNLSKKENQDSIPIIHPNH